MKICSLQCLNEVGFQYKHYIVLNIQMKSLDRYKDNKPYNYAPILDCFPLFTEPCPPANVVVETSCEERSALVSWSSSPVAETYSVVTTASQDGHVHSCNTTSNNCSLTGLHCEKQYTAFVTAHHENCSSNASESVTITTGICPASPTTVRVLVLIMTRCERFDIFLSVQVHAGLMVSQLRTTVLTSLRCSHGRPG